uniref:Major facilitator superfamily (MFS) profile domain-containing protein n=1 Tax=Graphocephala atropunctata TaxID=36148 RepID=A0A1B6MMF0_9HEMI
MVWSFLRRCCAPIPQRGVIAVMVMTGLAVQYLHRLAFNLAITVIAFQQEVSQNSTDEICSPPEVTEGHLQEQLKAEFSWDVNDQANLLGAFFVGYCISQIPGGILGDIFGPKNVLGYGVLLSGICSILTPISARIHVNALIAVRVLMGIAQGPVFPALSSFNARWALPHERAFLSAFMSSGVVVGAISSNAITGLLLDSLDQWENVFYIYAVLTVLWFVVWYLLAHDSVDTHPFITEKERTKIGDALNVELDVTNVKVPYCKIATSVRVWAMTVGNLGNDWVFYIIVTLLPQYLSYVLHFDVKANGLINSLPYIAMVSVSLSTSKLAEFIVKRGYMSKTIQCKVYLFFANIVPCLCLIFASYAGCDKVVAVAMFVVGFGCLGTVYSSVRVCHVDMAPNFAGTLMAIMNGVGSVAGIFTPQLFAIFITDQTVASWRMGFFSSTAIVLFTSAFFWIFGTSELQSWNSAPKTAHSLVAAEGEEGEDK